MSYHICNGEGDSVDAPSVAQMRDFLEALDPADEEHGAAWLVDEEGNGLEYEVGGNLCFSRRLADERHLSGVSHDRVIELWLLLANGRFDELEREPWQP